MTKAALFAVAVLCISCVGILFVDDYDAASTDGTTTTAPTFSSSDSTLTKCTASDKLNTNKTVMTITITATTGYAVPATDTTVKVEKDGSSLSSSSWEYKDVAADRSSAKIVVQVTTGEISVKVVCLEKLDADFKYTVDGKDEKNKDLSFAVKGEEYKATLDKKDGYNLSSVSVFIGTSTTPVSGVGFTDYKVTVPAASVTGDIMIKGNYVPKEYSLKSEGVKNASVEDDDLKPVFGKDFTFKLVPDSNYSIPDAKDVKVEGATGWEYDSITGQVKVTGVKGDIKVSALSLPRTITVVYMDGDKQIDMLMDEFYYGVGGALPDCQKKDYLFKGWFTEKDGHGKQVKAVNPQFLTSKLTVYAYYTDDLSGYDLEGKQLPYFIVAILGIVGFAAVIVLAKVRP